MMATTSPAGNCNGGKSPRPSVSPANTSNAPTNADNGISAP